jgi:MFS family permease
MMSLAAIFGNIGGAIGPAVGGLLLFLFSYQITGVAIGALGIVSTSIFCFLTKDPYKNMRNHPDLYGSR